MARKSDEEPEITEQEVEFEVEDDSDLDWEGYLSEGLLPVSRCHFLVKKAEIRDRTNDEGEAYKQISIQCEIDWIEEDKSYPGEGKKPQSRFINAYLRGKTAQRFRALYRGCTGRAMAPTGRNPKTGKPSINMNAVVAELQGLGCYSTITWRKTDEGYEDQLGWSFAQELDSISIPKNKFKAEASE